MSEQSLKKLKIKTGIVKRLIKEKVAYVKEAEQEEKKIEKYKTEGKDEHLIKKQIEVWQETLQMIPNCQRRLLTAFEDLNDIINSEESLKSTDEFATAKAVLEDARPHFPQ